MAPTVTLHAFAPNDLNGAVQYTLTDEDPYLRSLALKVEREGLGGAELVLSRTVGEEMFAFTPELFFRVLVHAYSDTVYYPWGFFLNKRHATVIHREEDGSEEWRLGGAGPKMYLDRAALGIGGPLSGWNVDLENGVWRWGDSATAGRILGRIIAQDGNLSDPALPDLTTTFDQTNDSASVAWADTNLGAADEPYTIPIGTSLLQSLWDLEDVLELTSWVELGTVASPKFELNVSQGLGADKTGNVFGSGVCLLKEGVNIADDALKVEGHSLRKASHVIVEGDRGKWAVAERPTFTPGDYVKYAKISYTRSGSVYWLEKAGIRWLKRQDNGEKSLSVEIVPGQSDATGLYFPAPDRVLWLSNLISVDTSADGSTHTSLDIQPSEDQLVTGFLLETHNAADDTDSTAQARSWDVTVYLNRERPGNIQRTPDQKSAASGGGGCKCIRLCNAAIACEDLTEGDLTAGTAANGDAEDTGGGQWSGAGYLTSAQFAGARSYGLASANSSDITYTFDPAQVFLEGVRYVLEFWHRSQGTTTSSIRSFGVAGGDETTDPIIAVRQETGADGTTWDLLRTCWTPTADRTGVRFRQQTSYSGTGVVALDDLKLYTAANDDLAGEGAEGARCDHGHRHSDLTGLSIPGSHPASAITFTPAGTIAADNVQAAIEEAAAEAGGGGGNALASVLVRRTSAQNVAGSGTETDISWDTEDEDTDGLWAIGTPTKLVVPAGLNGRRAIVFGGAIFTASTAGNYRHLRIRRAGAAMTPDAVTIVPDLAVALSAATQVHSHVLTLATGDEFTMVMRIDGTGIGVIAAHFGLYTVD